MYNSNLSKLMIVVLGLNASLIHGMDDLKKANLINSQAKKYIIKLVKLKGKIREKVTESFFENGVLPANDLADIVSDYVVISELEELHKVNNQLLKAARDEDIKAVEEALEQGADINNIDTYGRSALVVALIKRHKPIVKFLIAKGADVNNKRFNETTPLISQVRSYAWSEEYLIRKKIMSQIKLLLDSGADVNAVDCDGKTALWYVKSDTLCRKVVKLLLAKDSSDRQVVFDLDDHLFY